MSPVATLPVDDARHAVLRAADELFYARGIGGVAISDIQVRLGRVHASALHAVPLEAAIRRRLAHRPPRRGWRGSPTARRAPGEAGADPVLATFDAIAHWVATPGYRGCAFINSLAETNELDDATARSSPPQTRSHPAPRPPSPPATTRSPHPGFRRPPSPSSSTAPSSSAPSSPAPRRSTPRDPPSTTPPRNDPHMTLTVGALWRYPVKTLAGERLDTAEVTADGIVGDRIVHVRGPEGVRTSRRHHDLLGLHATLAPTASRSSRAEPWGAPEVLAPVRAAAGADATLARYDGPNASTCCRSWSPPTAPSRRSAATSAASDQHRRRRRRRPRRVRLARRRTPHRRHRHRARLSTRSLSHDHRRPRHAGRRPRRAQGHRPALRRQARPVFHTLPLTSGSRPISL